MNILHNAKLSTSNLFLIRCLWQYQIPFTKKYVLYISQREKQCYF